VVDLEEELMTRRSLLVGDVSAASSDGEKTCSEPHVSLNAHRPCYENEVLVLRSRF
jgi:hypothetical protein